MNRLRRQLTNCSIKSIPCESVETPVLREVRDRLRQLHDEQPTLMHEDDINRLVMEAKYLRRFVQRSGNDVEKAVQLTAEILRWRLEQRIPLFDYGSFPREFYERRMIFVHQTDRRGHLNVFARMKLFVKCDEFKEMFNPFLPFLYYKAMEVAVARGDRCGFTLVFDVGGVSLSQFDLSYAIWGIDVVCNKLPSVLRKVLIYEMPWLFRPFLKAILVFVPDEWRQAIHHCSASDLRKHIDEANLPGAVPADQSATDAADPSNLGLPMDLSRTKFLSEFSADEMRMIGLHPEKRVQYLAVLDTMRKIDQKSK